MLHLSPKTCIFLTVWIIIVQTVKADLFTVENGKNIELGEFNDVQLLTWKLKNTSSKPLRITKVNGGCSCVEENWPKVPIRPGKEAEIHVAYDPSTVQVGKLKRYVIVHISPGNKLMSLSFSGEIKRDIDFNPISSHLLLDAFRPGETWNSSIKISINEKIKDSFKILEVKSTENNILNHSVIKSSDGSFKLSLISTDILQTGEITDNISIKYLLDNVEYKRIYKVVGYCGNKLISSTRLVRVKLNQANSEELTKEYLVQFPDLINLAEFNAKTTKGEKVSFKLDGNKLKVKVVIPQNELIAENMGKIKIVAPGVPPESFVYLIEK